MRIDLDEEDIEVDMDDALGTFFLDKASDNRLDIFSPVDISVKISLSI